MFVNLGELFAKRSRFVFWATVPVCAVLLAWMTLETRYWDVAAGLDLTFLLYSVGVYDPKRFSWALRTSMGVFFLFCCWITVSEYVLPQKPGHKRDWGFLHGLVVLGIPAGIYALRGQAKHSSKKQPASPYAPTPIEPS
jgi:hypothetical protein